MVRTVFGRLAGCATRKTPINGQGLGGANPTSPLGAGGLGRFLFQPPAFPCSGGLPPPPPCVWTGFPAMCQRVLFGPRWLQEGLRERKMASKMAQDSGRRVKIASDTRPRGLKTAPRRFQVPSEASKDPPKRPKSFKNLKKINVFCLLAFSPPMGS